MSRIWSHYNWLKYLYKHKLTSNSYLTSTLIHLNKTLPFHSTIKSLSSLSSKPNSDKRTLSTIAIYNLSHTFITLTVPYGNLLSSLNPVTYFKFVKNNSKILQTMIIKSLKRKYK